MKKEEYMPGVNRINTYTDSRFSKKVLNQHGAFLIGDEPYEVELYQKQMQLQEERTQISMRV